MIFRQSIHPIFYFNKPTNMQKNERVYGKTLFPWEQEGITFEEWKRKMEEKKKSPRPLPFFGGPGGHTK